MDAGISRLGGRLIRRDDSKQGLQAGTVPRRDSAHISRGPEIGLPCLLCREPITIDQVEYELQFTSAGSASSLERTRLHQRCIAAWEMERTKV